MPEDVRDVIAERAAEQGQSVPGHLLAPVVHEANVLRNGPAFERTAGRRVSIPAHSNPEQIIREIGTTAASLIERRRVGGRG